jgi:general secretion pathway protein G
MSKRILLVSQYGPGSSYLALLKTLIVTVILGTLAAIVISQFANASTDARKGNMASQDQTIKSQIVLYMLQHDDTPPSAANLGGATWNALTEYSSVRGMVYATSTAAVAAGVNPPLGPYLPMAPVNPLTGSSVVAKFTPGSAPTASTANGWYYDANTGEFHGADTGGNMSDDGNTLLSQ